MADEKDIQSIRFIDSNGGVLRSTVNPEVTCLIPEGALQLQMNFIPVSVQVINVDKSLVHEFFGQGSAVSPIIVMEPVRRKFHKPLTLQIPIPKCGDNNVDLQKLKVLFSISGNGDNVRFEDITSSMNTSDHTNNRTLTFSSVCTGRIVLVSCSNSIIDIVDTMNDLFRKNITDGYKNGNLPEDLMFKAVKSGDVTKLQEALRMSGVNINHQNQDGQTALHIACKEGHTRVVQELLKKNADCNILTTRGNTPIHLACYYNRKDIVEILLDHGVNVNMPSQGEYPPLYTAILENNYDIMQLLISRSASPKWVSQDGLSLILVAVFSKFNRDKMFSMVELLKDSFDLESQTLSTQLKERGFKNHGEALLHCLILRTNNLGGKEILEPVRQKLANLSGGQLKEDLDNTELGAEDVVDCLKAVKENDTEKFDLIISKGFDVNSCTKRSVTALHLACLYGRQKMVEMILSLIKAADLSSVTDCLNQSISVNKQTQGGFTALYLAAQEGYKDIVSLLLESGANEKIVNNFGLTAQDIASEMGHKEVATMLRDSKVPRHLFESASSTDTNNSPAITVNKRYSANVDGIKKKEKRKSTNSCQLS